jgi:hypothetical protein
LTTRTFDDRIVGPDRALLDRAPHNTREHAMKRPLTWMALLAASCSTPTAPPVNMQPPPQSMAQVAPLRPEQPDGPQPRTVIVISDLHFGLGGKQASTGGSAPMVDGWDPYEDFRWSREWAEFLQQIDRDAQASGSAVDLILNGDAFELWQSRKNDCKSRDPEQGCSGREALARAQQVIAAHSEDLRRLGAFAMSGDNRVVIVPGNHDAALLFPEVAGAVQASTLASAERLRVSPTGYWISRDRRIYADHGHQIGLDPNGFHNWPTPFRERDGEHYLTRPWGEQFMQAFYNAYEDRYPIIDNIAAERDAVRFAITREGPLGLVQAVGKFVGFTLLKTSWSQRIDIARLQSPSAPDPVDNKPADGRTREGIFGSYLGQVLGSLQSQQVANRPVDLYVFSHTHGLDVGFEFASSSPSGKTRVVNSGAWQRVVGADWLKAEQARRGLPERDTLVGIRLEDLPPCYGVVRIKPYAINAAPQAEVLYYHAAPGVAGHLSPTCP